MTLGGKLGVGRSRPSQPKSSCSSTSGSSNPANEENRMRRNLPSAFSFAVVLALLLSLVALPGTQPSALGSATLVISQVYGGRGNSGATIKNHFIELYNLGSSP